jgi:eukaryotic-like serine/threonine-protein kinase
VSGRCTSSQTCGTQSNLNTVLSFFRLDFSVYLSYNFAMPDWIGTTIGNVRIEKLLARGGMAEVYLGSHLNLERPVAVKLLHSYIEEEPLLIERFRREAKVVAGLRHPNIVQIFDFDTVDGHPYIVMEYLKGPTLATYLRHLHQRKKRIPPEQVARLLNELSTALDYAHKQGVVHRDIKPGNILLHHKGDDFPLEQPLAEDVEAVITDFGLVRIMNTASQTASGTVSGTPAYMSPEQARGDPTDHHTDIYSLGIVLYEMLAGRVPFEADSTLTVLHMQIHTTPPPVPGIPPKVQAVIDRALLKNPEERFHSSRELAGEYSRSIGMTTQAVTVQEADRPSIEPVEAPVLVEVEPQPVVQPQTQPEPSSKPELQVKPESQPKVEPVSKPARGRSGVPLILFSVIGLLVLAGAGYLIFSGRGRSPAPSSTATSGAEVVTPNTSTSPLPSETAALALPSPERMVKVTAGTYNVGKDPEGTNQSAAQAINLDEYWIDQYPVTNLDFKQYMAEWTIPPDKENHPAIGVAWEAADAYCRALNKRLPSEAEWEAAARGSGPDPQLYPWGRDAAQALKLPNQTYEVGTQTFNVSPVGAFDMFGNVYEWVGEPYGKLTAGKRILRGVRYSLPYDLAFRLEVAPTDTNYIQHAGFRCAATQVSQ